jgi:glutamate 5-kinase
MAGQASKMGKGGMISKIEAAEICFKNKSDMVITSGIRNKPIRSLNAKGKATWFVRK